MMKDDVQLPKESIETLFAQAPDRAKHWTVAAAHLFLDYSKNRISDAQLLKLMQWADSTALCDAIDAQFSGKIVNQTEQRAVLHTALRDFSHTPIQVGDQQVASDVHATLARMQAFAESVRAGTFLGAGNAPITDVLHLGIGGSDLGPAMVYRALSAYHDGPTCHFISGIDDAHFKKLLARLCPETTLVFIASKSFTTEETLWNAQCVRDWMGETIWARHAFALTANVARANAKGFTAERIFPFWDWVGGRFSLWSSVGLTLALAFGFSVFKKMLQGAYAMDQHFRSAPVSENMPVLLALLGVWYAASAGAQTQAIIPYSDRLALLPAYLQQSHMESLGKSVTMAGQPVMGQTGAIIWGGAGTASQHSFHQLLMQGTHCVPVDFILPLKYEDDAPLNAQLIAHCLAQSQVLMCGDQPATDDPLFAHKRIAGNCPSNILMMPVLSPEALGALIALYEHKIFVQSHLWQINAFDQWGVERGKVLARSILSDIQAGKVTHAYDPSTKQLFTRILQAAQGKESAGVR